MCQYLRTGRWLEYEIGFQKTGALTVLGYRVTGPNYARNKDIAEKFDGSRPSCRIASDALQDSPLPGSKVHPESVRRAEMVRQLPHHFEDKEGTPMEVLLYGPRAKYFEGELNRKFLHRPDGLLVIDVTPQPRIGIRPARSWGSRFPRPVPAIHSSQV